MRSLRKIQKFVLIPGFILLIFSLVGCGGGGGDASSQSGTAVETNNSETEISGRA